VDGNGNFGSPGNDPAAAMRYCLSPSSRIRMADGGTFRIGDVAPDAAPPPPATAVGAPAVAATALRPSGNAEFPAPDGPGVRTSPVVSDSGFVSRGTPVRVVETAGARVLVRPIPPVATTTAS
jgi:hypothetical protein